MQQEYRAAMANLPGATSAETCRHIISFPENLAAIRILDIGSGESNYVSWLNAHGASAYGIDARYGDRSRLEKDFAQGLEYAPRKSLAVSSYGTQAWEEFVARTEGTRKKFLSHFDANRRNYIASLAGYLPFADGSFDFVLSINCITNGLDKADYEIFQHVVFEALRVLKNDGELQLYPFLGKASSDAIRNHKKLLKSLRDYKIEDVPEAWYKKLRIRKS